MQTKQQKIEELENEVQNLRNELNQVRDEYARDLDLFAKEIDHFIEINDSLEDAGRKIIARIDEVTAHRSFLSQTLTAIAYYGGNDASIPAEIASVALREFGVELKRERINHESS